MSFLKEISVVFLPNPTGCPLHHLASQGTAMGFGPYKRYANVSCHSREGKFYRKPRFFHEIERFSAFCRIQDLFTSTLGSFFVRTSAHVSTCYARSLPPKDGKQALYVGICGIFAF